MLDAEVSATANSPFRRTDNDGVTVLFIYWDCSQDRKLIYKAKTEACSVLCIRICPLGLYCYDLNYATRAACSEVLVRAGKWGTGTTLELWRNFLLYILHFIKSNNTYTKTELNFLQFLHFKAYRLLYVPPGSTFKNSTWCSLCTACFVQISEQTATNALYIEGKDKVIPLQARCGPEGG